MASPRIGSTGVVEAKGDLLAFDGTDLERLPPGADGTILRANSLQPLGLKWDTADDIPGIGYNVAFGANFASAATQGNHHQVNGEANSANVAALVPQTEVTLYKTGSITRISWNTATANATTVYKIIKNGVVASTITLTGATGALMLGVPVPVALGDEIAVEYDAGQFPGNSNVQLFIE